MTWTPITVKPITVASNSTDYKLVVGRHRLDAVHKLGHATIKAVLARGDSSDADLWEIDENLIRAELTKLERDQHNKRRQEIFEARASG